MRFSGRQALQTKRESKRLNGIGKMWKPGDTLRVYYPVFLDPTTGQWDVIVYLCYGHSIDPKAVSLRRVFIPTNAELEDGQPKKPDVLYQFSRISPLFLEGERAEKEAKINNKKGLKDSERKQMLEEIKAEFDQKSPAVGRLECKIATEVVAVPLDRDGRPNGDEARLVSQELSEGKLQKLLNLLSSSKYAPEADAKYFEVDYAFGNSGVKSKDGQVDPQGITAEYKLSKTHPEEFLKIQGQLSALPEDSDMIRKRNSSFHPVEDADILGGLNTYCVLNSEFLDALDDDGKERLNKNTAILRTLRLTPEDETEDGEGKEDGVEGNEHLSLEELMAQDAERARKEAGQDDETLEDKVNEMNLQGLGANND